MEIGTQPMLPGMPKARGKVTWGRKASDVERIVDKFAAVRGHPVFVGMARRHAKAMLAAGYTIDEVCKAIDWLASHHRFGEWSWTMAFVGRQMPAFRRREEQAAQECILEEIVVPDDWGC